MIDRTARNTLASALRALASGQITNDQFEDRLAQESADLAVREVFLSGAWFLYDDLHEHRLVGRYRPSPEGRTEIARWVLFLRTDLEYEWPATAGLPAFLWFLAIVGTLGLALPLRRRLYRRSGDPTVWPFHSRAQYEAALKNPVYLNGAA
jgi:hypothetical protein